MLICEVIGHVWATKKEPSLSGLKLMVTRQLTPDYQPTDHTLVAVDIVGAGIGERVLVVSGSTARQVFGQDGKVATDAAIVGIIDSVEA